MRENLLARRFVRHHLANPRVWAAYEAAILKIINSGRKHGGVKAITESIRWQTRQSLFNDYDPFYSRLFAHTYPHFADFFVYKRSAADYINYAARLEGDSEGALDWEEPQLSLELEHSTTT